MLIQKAKKEHWFIEVILLMSSWSTEHLKQLKEITNHKVIYDGYEFIWMSKLDNEWSRHYVANFDNYNKPMSWIYFNISIWDNEY